MSSPRPEFCPQVQIPKDTCSRGRLASRPWGGASLAPLPCLLLSALARSPHVLVLAICVSSGPLGCPGEPRAQRVQAPCGVRAGMRVRALHAGRRLIPRWQQGAEAGAAPGSPSGGFFGTGSQGVQQRLHRALPAARASQDGHSRSPARRGGLSHSQPVCPGQDPSRGKSHRCAADQGSSGNALVLPPPGQGSRPRAPPRRHFQLPQAARFGEGSCHLPVSFPSSVKRGD